MGQSDTSATAKHSSIEAHFAAAQQAQHDQDYATAEREYRAALALAPEFAEVHMNLGLVYQLEDRSPEAMSEFRRALKIKPLAGANFFLGVDYCKQGEGAKAVPYLKAALKAQPDRRDIWLWLANAQESAGQLQAELITLHRALELQPKDVDLLYLLGNAYERLGKQVVAHLEKIAPGSSRSEQLLGESYAASSEWPSAVVRLQNALAASPNTAGLHTEIGEVLLRAGKLNPAIREFDEELLRDPGSLRALVRRGEARLIQDNLDGALEDWEKAVAIDLEQTERILGLREAGFGDSSLEQLPDSAHEKVQKLDQDLQNRNSPAAHLALAFVAQQTGNLSQTMAESDLMASSAASQNHIVKKCTEEDVNHALQRQEFSRIPPCADKILNPRSPPELRFRVAAALLEAGQSEAALKTLAGLPAAEGASAEATYWRARCYEQLATAAYLRLYQADPNSYRSHQLMGDLESARGDDGKAIEEYRAAIAFKPSLPNLHYSLGHLLWKDLKVPEARVELEAELALNPRHAGALNDLGNTYLLEHQPDKALPYLTRALAIDSENPDLHRDLGTAYFGLNDYRKAEEHFKIATSSDQDGSVHYQLARVYRALGDKKKAAQEFAISSALNGESHTKLEKRTERLQQVTKFAEDP